MTGLNKLNEEMGLGHEKPHPVFPGKTSWVYSEQNQRGLYRRWNEFMRASSWQDISVPDRTTEIVDRDNVLA